MRLRFVFVIFFTLLFVVLTGEARADEAEDILQDKTLTNSGWCRVSFPPTTNIIVPCERYVGKDGRVYIVLFHPYTGKIVSIKEINRETGEQKNIWAAPLEVKS